MRINSINMAMPTNKTSVNRVNNNSFKGSGAGYAAGKAVKAAAGFAAVGFFGALAAILAAGFGLAKLADKEIKSDDLDYKDIYDDDFARRYM